MSELTNTSTVYPFTVNDTSGNPVSLSDYEGKVLLIVNTASKCGFTPQLEGMESLYKEFKDQGFELLAFPSNDFAGQEPLEGEAIAQFCVTNYQASYPIFDKVHVKGKEATPLYQFLADKKKNGKVGIQPKWNFHKYLIDRQGKVVNYFFSFTTPTSKKIKRAIQKLL